MRVFRDTALLASSDIANHSHSQQISNVHGAANDLQQISTFSGIKRQAEDYKDLHSLSPDKPCFGFLMSS